MTRLDNLATVLLTAPLPDMIDYFGISAGDVRKQTLENIKAACPELASLMKELAAMGRLRRWLSFLKRRKKRRLWAEHAPACYLAAVVKCGMDKVTDD